jgi:hypothetical protein
MEEAEGEARARAAVAGLAVGKQGGAETRHFGFSRIEKAARKAALSRKSLYKFRISGWRAKHANFFGMDRL